MPEKPIAAHVRSFKTSLNKRNPKSYTPNLTPIDLKTISPKM